MNNKDLENYSLENFIEDESFINYCLRKNTVDFDFWYNWIATHPEKEKQVEKAEYYILHFSAGKTEYEYRQELIKAVSKTGLEFDGVGNEREIDFLYRNKYSNLSNGKSRKTLLWGISTLGFLLFAGVILTIRSCR